MTFQKIFTQKLFSNEFYKLLGLEYLSINRYNKDQLYDYEILSIKEKNNLPIHLAIMLRSNGSHLYDFAQDNNIELYDQMLSNCSICLIIHKESDGYNDVYVVSKFIKFQ